MVKLGDILLYIKWKGMADSGLSIQAAGESSRQKKAELTSVSPSLSVKSMEAMSSGHMRNRISSWTQPCERTPPPTKALAKSTYTVVNI